MCIIVVKQMDVEMPSLDVLRRCFQANPDGAGFMYADGKHVRIRKGFMEFDDFADALLGEVDDLFGTAIVMHFRIATHGKVVPECCHPFPITSDADKIRATSVDSRFGIAHNGVIPGRVTNEKWSDTMDFVADIAAPLARMNPNFIHSDDARELLEGACQSKLAIMDNAGDIVTVGKFNEQDGVLFSNDSYLRKTYGWSSYSTIWDYYDDFYGYRADEKENTAAFGDLEEAVSMLPFDACEVCEARYDCALYIPECTNDAMAEEAVEYYKDLVTD